MEDSINAYTSKVHEIKEMGLTDWMIGLDENGWKANRWTKHGLDRLYVTMPCGEKFFLPIVDNAVVDPGNLPIPFGDLQKVAEIGLDTYERNDHEPFCMNSEF
jgi:hypothetical protein